MTLLASLLLAGETKNAASFPDPSKPWTVVDYETFANAIKAGKKKNLPTQKDPRSARLFQRLVNPENLAQCTQSSNQYTNLTSVDALLTVLGKSIWPEYLAGENDPYPEIAQILGFSIDVIKARTDIVKKMLAMLEMHASGKSTPAATPKQIAEITEKLRDEASAHIVTNYAQSWLLLKKFYQFFSPADRLRILESTHANLPSLKSFCGEKQRAVLNACGVALRPFLKTPEEQKLLDDSLDLLKIARAASDAKPVAIERFPDPNRPWKSDDYKTAASEMNRAPDALPCLKDPKSSEIFKRMVNPENLRHCSDRSIPFMERFSSHSSIFEAAMITLWQKYATALELGDDVNLEMAELLRFSIACTITNNHLLDESVNAMRVPDPIEANRPLLEDAQRRTKNAITLAQLQQVIISLSFNRRFTPAHRLLILAELGRALPELTPALFEESKAMLRKEISFLLNSTAEPAERQALEACLLALKSSPDAETTARDRITEPTISAPGFRLVRACRRQSLPVVPVPGANAIVSVLSAAGLPTKGCLPSKTSARTAFLVGPSAEIRDRLARTSLKGEFVLLIAPADYVL